MDLEVQANAMETGRQEIALWLAGHGILDAHAHLSEVRAVLRVAERLPVAARVQQVQRSEASRH